MAVSDICKSAETQPVQHQQSNAVANKRIAVRMSDEPRAGALFVADLLACDRMEDLWTG